MGRPVHTSGCESRSRGCAEADESDDRRARRFIDASRAHADPSPSRRCWLADRGQSLLGRSYPGRKFVELPGDAHFSFVGNSDAFDDEIEEFLTGTRSAREPDRVLATVLV